MSNPLEAALKAARAKRGLEQVASQAPEATPKADGDDVITCPSCGHEFSDYRTDSEAAEVDEQDEDNDGDDDSDGIDDAPAWEDSGTSGLSFRSRKATASELRSLKRGSQNR